ncbi:polyprenyl synthetase [Streptomyces sp. NPDC058657]|uniref:polyprenyl synthetase n=1 Tax=unclassified Streptomyces TaxID=2593676 RepID=UPI00364A5712
MTRNTEDQAGPDGHVVLLAVGLADLAVRTAGSALGAARGLMRRSDAAALATEAERDLMARGRLVLDRYAAAPPAYLETLAQQSLARRAVDDR